MNVRLLIAAVPMQIVLIHVDHIYVHVKVVTKAMEKHVLPHLVDVQEVLGM